MCSAAAGASGRSLDVRVASDEDGESRGRRGAAIMGRTGSRPTGSFFVIDYLAPWSRQVSPFCPCRATDSTALGLRHRLSFCVSFSPFHSPPRRETTRPVVPLPLSRLLSLLRTPVSQTLAKPRRRQRLSCRSTRPLRFHRDGTGSFFAVIFIVSSSKIAHAHRVFHFDF